MNSEQVDRLRAELEFIRAHPEKWNQGVWADVANQGKIETAEEAACATYGCLAGNACVNAGRVRYEQERSPLWGYASNGHSHVVTNYVTRWTAIVVNEDGEDSSWWHEAGELFGLDTHERDLLFDSENNLFRLYWLANQFTEGEIKIPSTVEPYDADDFAMLTRNQLDDLYYDNSRAEDED